MDLTFLRTVGAPKTAAPLVVTGERELVQADLPLLEKARGSESNALKRITQRHHALARLIAEGTHSMAECGLIVGLSPSRISILKDDPTFQELVRFYEKTQAELYRDVHEELAATTMEAVSEIRERLEDDDTRKQISISTLIEITKMGADRTGNGPSTTSTNVNINIGIAERMKAARARADRAMQIEAKPKAAE